MTDSVEFDKTNQNIKMDTIHYMETLPDLSWKALFTFGYAGSFCRVLLGQGFRALQDAEHWIATEAQNWLNALNTQL